MPKYIVDIRETLIKGVEVEASSISEAKALAKDMYNDGDIVLGEESFTGDVDVRVLDVEGSEIDLKQSFEDEIQKSRPSYKNENRDKDDDSDFESDMEDVIEEDGLFDDGMMYDDEMGDLDDDSFGDSEDEDDVFEDDDDTDFI